MDRITKKQIHNRHHLARQLLLSELRLVYEYSDDLDERKDDLLYYEREWKKRVVSAANQTQKYLRDYPDGEMRVKFFDEIIVNQLDRTAICEKLHISESTYYNWRNIVISYFAQIMGVWV